MPNTGLVPLLRRSFWISFVAIAAIVLSVVVVTAVERARDGWSQHSLSVMRLARTSQLLAVDEETGVRGYLLTGDSAALAPYAAAGPRLRVLLDSLVAETSDNRQQQQRAEAFAAAIARWDTTFASPAIAARASSDGPAARAFGQGGLAGKVLFDDIRTRYFEFQTEEEMIYRQRARTATWLRTTNLVVSVLGLVALAAILVMLRRRVTRQAAALEQRQELLEEQATELEEQATTLQEQASELEAQTEELQDTVKELGRKNEELDAFSSSVAHDLRSPLRSIDGFSHLLLTDYAARLDAGGLDALKRIRANAQRMGELIDGLLTLARVSGAEMRRVAVSLTEIASTVGDDLLRTAPADRSIDYVVRSSLTVRGDARLLRVVIHNLVENAFKFTRSQSDARVEIGSTTVNGEPTFYVTDNGIGFDMRYANTLFGPFERLHHDPTYEGLGIGLATVRRIIDRHGGRLWAEAEPGRGATFYFTLPV